MATQDFNTVLARYQQNLTDYKVTGNAGLQSVVDVDKTWLDSYIASLERRSQNQQSFIQKFMADYQTANPDLIEMQGRLKEIRAKGPILQDAYETEHQAKEEEPVDYTAYYVKAGLIVGIAAAMSFAQGDRWFLVLGALLLQLSLILDCVDGEVARATHRFSVIGAWLDASTDRVKEYAVYAGLAAGAVVTGVESQLAWGIALILMIVQTARHMGDYNFAAIQKMREAALPQVSLLDPHDPWGEGYATFSVRVNSRSSLRWFKKVIHMPIGERWLVLSAVAAIFSPLAALIALLALTSLAWLYTLIGRVVRTRRWEKLPVGVELIIAQRDNGPILDSLPQVFRPAPISRWNWATPMINRLIEMGVVALIAWIWFTPWITLAFGYLFIVAFHHYDNLYRALAGSRAPRWITWGALGREGRTIVVVVAALIGITAFYDALNIGVAWLFMWCVIIASAQYLSARKVIML